MSSTGELVRAALVADSAVNAIVAGRVFPNVMPQGTTLPAIVYSVISDVPENSLDGTPATRVRNARVQVDCYARPASVGGGGYLQVQALADAVDLVLAATSMNGWREVSRDLYDDETQYHRVSMDFSLWR